MKKSITSKERGSETGRKKPRRWRPGKGERVTVGMDLGDKTSRYCMLNDRGEVMYEGSTPTTKKGMAQAFGMLKSSRIAMEVGTHSPWVSRLLESYGHEVIVANARQVRLISESSRKNDKLDARLLGRLARVDPELLRPIRHRSWQGQQHLMVIRVRAGLMEARTKLINTARGLAKAMGERLPKCDADQMGVEKLEGIGADWSEPLEWLLQEVESLTEKIKACDEQIEQVARKHYPETQLLKQVSGVGTLTALTFILTLEDANRFQRSRDVGCYVGLRPKQGDSGESQPQLRISKEGDSYLRTLLVQAGHCILGRRSPDTDLKRFGERLAQRGGKNAKKRAVVAVARKLAILLHRLWVTGDVYEPLRNSQARDKQAA